MSRAIPPRSPNRKPVDATLNQKNRIPGNSQREAGARKPNTSPPLIAKRKPALKALPLTAHVPGVNVNFRHVDHRTSARNLANPGESGPQRTRRC